MEKTLVSVVMGSDSDLCIVKSALEILEEFEIPYESRILSAHRSPSETANYSKTLGKRGVKVVIAAAGGAAHLAGVIAAHTTLPVIGLPIKTQTLNGIDSLYSIVQMPPGVPVATVGINAGKNAGLLAIQIVALGNSLLQMKLTSYKKKQNDGVLKKSASLQKIGYREYLKILDKK